MDASRSDIKSSDKNSTVNQGQRVHTQQQPNVQQYRGQVLVQPPVQRIIHTRIPVPRQFQPRVQVAGQLFQPPRPLIPQPPSQQFQQPHLQQGRPLYQRLQVVAPTQTQDLNVQVCQEFRPPAPQQFQQSHHQQQFQQPLSRRFQVLAPTQLKQQRPRQDIRVQVPQFSPPAPQQIQGQIIQQVQVLFDIIWVPNSKISSLDALAW